MTGKDCFIPGVECRIEGAADGPLEGMSFAAKDLFDVAGFPTGGGNPDWAAFNPIPIRHAWAVATLLDAGATLIGETITDEGVGQWRGGRRLDGYVRPAGVRRRRLHHGAATAQRQTFPWGFYYS